MQVSRNAGTCPHCGRPLRKKYMTKPAGCFLQLLGIGLCLFGFFKFTDSVTAGIVWVVIGGLLLWGGGLPSRS